MTVSFWRLGWRTLWRDLRSGDLRLLMVAVALAVAALTAVGFFADRLSAGLQRDARQLLGGDAVVASDNPTPAAFVAQAHALGLQQVTTLSFSTMARASDAQGGAAKLVALKAVEAGYPARGQLRLADPSGDPAGAEVPTDRIPEHGQAWVDPAVLDALQLHPGDELLLGDSRFRISAVLAYEPDRGAGFMNFAPRVMVNSADLPATGLVQPASRVSYRMALTGPDAAVVQYLDWAEAALKSGPGTGARPVRGVRLESLQTGRPEMSQTLERANRFLNLVALLAALLCAVAVALAARSFAAQRLDDCAMLRVLGLSQRSMASAYTLEFGLAGVLASAVGVLLGYVVHTLFVYLLAGLVQNALPAPSLWPVGLGLGMGLTLLFGFGLPPVLQLAQVPPLRVLRRDLGQLRPTSAGVLALGVLGFSALLLVVANDRTLGLIAVGGFAGAVLLFALLGWLAVRALRASVRENTAPRWLVLATRQVAARPAYTVVQISALSVGLLALLLLVLLRTDLIASWRQTTPPDAPNRFVINVMPDQSAAFRQNLERAGIAHYDWYPMFRGRLISINGRAVTPQDYSEERAQRLVEREFNLSNSAVAPAHNTVVAGHWQDGEADAISVEEGLAKALGLQLGDRLVFNIGGVSSSARITSLRKVDWGSMRANFFVLYPVERMPEAIPATFMTAFRAPATQGFDSALVHAFPNITSVDMTATLNQVQRVLDQVIQAVQYLFGFTLAAGLVVLFAAVTATREERAREYAIMRAVGAQAALLRQVQRAELAGVGLLAGALAAALASAIGWALAHYVFEFAWTVSYTVLLWGALSGAALALAAGWWGLRGVLRRPVVDTLRAAA